MTSFGDPHFWTFLQLIDILQMSVKDFDILSDVIGVFLRCEKPPRDVGDDFVKNALGSFEMSVTVDDKYY